jgi:hypothetical protein
VIFPACQKNFSSLHPLFKISKPISTDFRDFFVNLDNFIPSGQAIFFLNSQKLTLTAELGLTLGLGLLVMPGYLHCWLAVTYLLTTNQYEKPTEPETSEW